MLDVVSEIKNWSTQVLIDSLNEIANAVLEFIFEYTTKFFDTAQTAINMEQVNLLLTLTNLLASSFLIAMMMKQYAAIHIFEVDGDSDEDPIKILEKGCLVLAAIQLQSFMLTFLLNLAEKINNEVTSFVKIDYKDINMIFDVMEQITKNSIIICILSIFYIVGIVLFLVKALKRSAELCLMKILFPLFACNITTVSMEIFRSFFMSYMITIFGYIVQIALFRLSIVMIYSNSEILFYLSVAFIFSAASAPKWLDKYVYTSGIGKGVSGGARTATYMLPQLMRSFK